jgi:hypothetical protein
MRTVFSRMSHPPTVRSSTALPLKTTPRFTLSAVVVTVPSHGEWGMPEAMMNLGSQSLEEPLVACFHVCKRIGFGLPRMAVVSPDPPPVNEMIGF